MKILITLVVIPFLALLIAVGFAYSGLYDVRANSPHSGFVSWFLSATSHSSIERRTARMGVPDLSDDALWPVVSFMLKLPELDVAD